MKYKTNTQECKKSCSKAPNGTHSVNYIDEEDLYDKMVRCVWCKKEFEWN